MSAESRLRELHDLLTALVERDLPAALVVGCTDPETVYLAHALARLDEQSPADRILVVTAPFTTAGALAGLVHACTGAPSPADAAADPVRSIRDAITHALAALPVGDHRLLLALVPAHIEDPAAFAALAQSLLSSDLPAALRLVLRDDRDAPRHLVTAEASPSEHLLAYRFRLTTDIIVADLTSTAMDAARKPDERAAAVIQLALRDLGHGRIDRALASFAVAEGLASAPALQALALGLRADAHRAAGDLHAALDTGARALRRAVDVRSAPIVHHVAMALGQTTRHLGRLADAASCFALAEQTAAHHPTARARARAERAALPEVTQ